MNPQNAGQRRFRMIACDILFREVCRLAADAPNIVDLEFVRKGLHDLPTDDMRADLQRRIDATDPNVYDAVLLGYARCNDGTVGLRARDIPLILPRAHDCITLFLGSRQRYREYHDAHPGTYFRTSGWIERNFADGDATIMHGLGLNKSFDEYVAKYGRENAEYIAEFLDSWKRNYDRLAFIDMGVASQLGYSEHTRREADQRGWKFEQVRGDPSLLAALMAGRWDSSDFVIVPPGWRITPRNDERVLDSAEPAHPDQDAAR
jgi:hypothetical protein